MRYFEISETRAHRPPSTSGTRKPNPPLPPKDARREAERRAGLQKRIQDAQRKYAERVQDLLVH
jgi:hypothetical protein